MKDFLVLAFRYTLQYTEANDTVILVIKWMMTMMNEDDITVLLCSSQMGQTITFTFLNCLIVDVCRKKVLNEFFVQSCLCFVVKESSSIIK